MQKYSVRPELNDTMAPELNEYPELLRHLLYHRGIATKREAEEFLMPNYETGLHDPFLLKDMEKAVARVLDAFTRAEKIVIYSDYDADGIPGGVVLHDFFKKIGYTNFTNYFPHRFDEGYGLHVAAVEAFKTDGVGLIITIDCGIADTDAVARAQELGIDVIVTDHHLTQGDKLPPAFAIINPKQDDCEYPFPMLCGSGIMYKFVQALLKRKDFGIKEGSEKWLLDMVGFATLADMVPLRGENRVLAHFGLKVLRRTPRLGLRKLLERANVRISFLNEEDVGFTLAPRINAASRMGKPSEAFEVLTATEEEHASKISKYLHDLNDERKAQAAIMTKEAKKALKNRANVDQLDVIVMGNPDWKPPLVGPVCNGVVQTYKVPVFMWGRASETEFKGSCRSEGRTNVLELMQSVVPGTFTEFGGHAMSGGFSVAYDKIHTLQDELTKAYEKLHATRTAADTTTLVDRRLTLDDVTWLTYNEIENLSPFGVDNLRPTFVFERVQIAGVKLFGKEKNHLELEFRTSQNKKIVAIAFFKTDHDFGEQPLKVGDSINLIANIEKSVFRNFPELRLRIVDIL